MTLETPYMTMPMVGTLLWERLITGPAFPPSIAPLAEPDQLLAPPRPLFVKQPLVVQAGTSTPGAPTFYLRHELIASVERTDDGVVVASDTLDESGYGPTFEAAWTDFLTSLRDRLLSLTAREATLSGHERAVLTLLRDSLHS